MLNSDKSVRLELGGPGLHPYSAVKITGLSLISPGFCEETALSTIFKNVKINKIDVVVNIHVKNQMHILLLQLVLNIRHLLLWMTHM